MIYTITFSPSIDYVINSKGNFNANDLNRITDYEFVPGGKGINASIVLKRIGFDNKAITFLGGSTKNFFLNLIKNEGIELVEFNSKNDTRINVKMFANNNSFEINGPRTIVDDESFDNLLNFINQLNENDFIFIMGICDDTKLIRLVEKIYSKKIEFALDVDSNVVLELLKFSPFLIKPNKNEIESLLNKKINNQEDMKNAMFSLKSKGLKNILVSNGKEGSYFLSEDNNFFQVKLKKEFEIISTVGAGDTLISSFAMLYKSTKNVKDSLKKATSLSVGTSMTKFLASQKDLEKYLDFIEIIEL